MVNTLCLYFAHLLLFRFTVVAVMAPNFLTVTSQQHQF